MATVPDSGMDLESRASASNQEILGKHLAMLGVGAAVVGRQPPTHVATPQNEKKTESRGSVGSLLRGTQAVNPVLRRAMQFTFSSDVEKFLSGQVALPVEPALGGAEAPGSPGTPKNLTPDFEAAKDDPYDVPGNSTKTSGRQLPNWHGPSLAALPPDAFEPTTPPSKRHSTARMDSAETLVLSPSAGKRADDGAGSSTDVRARSVGDTSKAVEGAAPHSVEAGGLPGPGLEEAAELPGPLGPDVQQAEVPGPHGPEVVREEVPAVPAVDPPAGVPGPAAPAAKAAPKAKAFATPRISDGMSPGTVGRIRNQRAERKREMSRLWHKENPTKKAKKNERNHGPSAHSTAHNARWAFVRAYRVQNPQSTTNDAHAAWMASSERAAIAASRNGDQH